MSGEGEAVPGLSISLTGSPVQPEAQTTLPEPKQQQPEPQEQRPSHPSFLEMTAANLGIGAEETAQMTTPELERLVAHVSRYRPQQQQFQPPPQEQPEEPQDSFDWGVDADGQPIGEDRVPPAVRQVKDIPALRREIAELREALVQQNQKTRVQLIDEHFAALGKDYEGLVGSGPAMRYQKDDPERVMRISMLAAVGVEPEHPEFAARLRKVASKVRAKFAPVAETNGHQQRNRLTGRFESQDELEAWNNGASAPATQRRSPAAPMTPFERHLEDVRRERAALGQEPVVAGDPGNWLV